MTNNYKPLDETYFLDNNAPVPAGLLKDDYDNIVQVDLNQRKYQTIRGWNVGRTDAINSDNDEPIAFGDAITPNRLLGYTPISGSFPDRSTRGFQIIPCDTKGTVLAIPFYKSTTSNTVDITITYQLENSPIYMSCGYSSDPAFPGSFTALLPTPPISGESFINTDFYAQGGADDIRKIDVRNDVISFTNTPTRKLVNTTGINSLVGIQKFTIPIPFGIAGNMTMYLLLAPTWNPITFDTERLPVLYTDSSLRIDRNTIRDTVKDATISFSALQNFYSISGGKVPLGLRVYRDSTNESYYHHVLFITPGRNTLSWDTDEVSWIVYPELAETVIQDPSTFRYDVHPVSKLTIFGTNIRERYIP